MGPRLFQGNLGPGWWNIIPFGHKLEENPVIHKCPWWSWKLVKDWTEFIQFQPMDLLWALRVESSVGREGFSGILMFGQLFTFHLHSNTDLIYPRIAWNHIRHAQHPTSLNPHLETEIKDLAETATLEGVRLALEHELLGLQLFWPTSKVYNMVHAMPSQLDLSWN